MSTNKTTNLGLHSWVRSDPFKMDEFNENFDKLDQAVGKNKDAIEKKVDQSALDAVSEVANGRAQIIAESYKGKGVWGKTKPTEITFPFTPKLVILFASPIVTGSSHVAFFPLFWNSTTQFTYSGYPNYVSYNGNTVSWYTDPYEGYPSFQLNDGATTYHYIAIG